MPTEAYAPPEKGLHSVPTGLDYDRDSLWRSKPLTPAQLLVSDVRLEQWRPDRAMLEVNDRSASQIVPETAALTPSASLVRANDAASNPIEKQRFTNLEQDYGWIRHLRLRQLQRHTYDPEDTAKVRWIHVSSKFPEYLSGFLWALSDDMPSMSRSMRLLDHVVQQQTRFSKHGNYFSPFYQQLGARKTGGTGEEYPSLMSCPFLDWTVQGQTPPLRFQVDRREGYHSSRSASHVLRTILQHYYRLEDTTDREKNQVFNKHKPWTTNRDLDLKVRQWYGHYPSGLNVDELWILCIDAQHIVTFSSNQSWKARWPPLQLSSRISAVSFRGIRNSYFFSPRGQTNEYTAATHAIASLNGAVGIMHRNFWPDVVLCLADRYAGYLGHLKYRLHRSPSTKLVMDLITCEDELNIVIQITQQQLETIKSLQNSIPGFHGSGTLNDGLPSWPTSQHQVTGAYGELNDPPAPTYRESVRYNARSSLTDPIAQLVDNLQRELIDLQDLRDNANSLVTRTIQLVNIRLEDHGKAIMVFTVVTIIFLPLNFVSSFFGMNFSDIRDMEQTQWLFWAVAICVTIAVLAASVFLAFSGGAIYEKFIFWRDKQHEHGLSTTTLLRQQLPNNGAATFRVLGVDRTRPGHTTF